MSRTGGLRAKVADVLMPWAARHASVWPSQHATHGVLLDQMREVEGRRRDGVYLVGRLHDALRDVDPAGYVGSPLETDEVLPFLEAPDP